MAELAGPEQTGPQLRIKPDANKNSGQCTFYNPNGRRLLPTTLNSTLVEDNTRRDADMCGAIGRNEHAPAGFSR